MKKIYVYISPIIRIKVVFFFILFLSAKQLSAQLTYIPDPAFRAFLQTTFPAAMIFPDSLDQNDSIVLSTASINCSNKLIYDLTGISAFVNLTTLTCSLNNLSSLPVLPDSVHSLDCSGNLITSISVLPVALKIFNCENCLLNVLPPLPSGLTELYCRYNFLSTIPALPFSLQSLSCKNNQITSLPALPVNLTVLDCSDNQLSLLPPLPSALTTLLCSFNVLSALPTLPNGLLILTCNSNPSLSLPPTLPPLLQILDVSGVPSIFIPALPGSLLTFVCRSMLPSLTTLPALPVNLTKLDFRNNNVSILPVLPSGIKQLYADNNNLSILPQPLPAALDELKLVNNPISCIPWLYQGILFVDTDVSDCLLNKPAGCLNCSSYPTCTPAYNCNNVSYVNGTVFNDLNMDGIYNASEPGRPECFIYSTNGNFSTGADTNGIYYLPSDTGISFTVQTQIPLYRILSTTPSSHFFSNYGIIDSLNHIGFYDLPNINDLSLSFYSYGFIKPGYTYQSLLLLDNPGTTVQNGQLFFVKPSLATFISANPVQSQVSGDTIFWNVTNLTPLTSTLQYKVALHIPPGTALGTTMTGYAGVYTAAIDSVPGNNYASETLTVLGSFDPNDKIAEPVNEFTTTQLANGEFMTYMVRFQNTGTASADQVVIVDSLSSDFDLITFRITGASHTYTWKIENRILFVRFDNINLPDSNSNESLSHGFLRYQIKPVASIPTGEVIYNAACIYFDFNMPVHTNSTSTEIVMPSAIPNANLENNDFWLFPNPSGGMLTIRFTNPDVNSFADFKIIDLTGRSVMQGKMKSPDQQIDIHSLQPGMYIIMLTYKEQWIPQQFVKQ